LDIAARAGKICDQVSLVTESLEDVGDKLAKATSSWEQTRKRLTSGNGNLLRQAHQLKDLGAKARRSLPAPDEEEDTEDLQDDSTD
ncbi:MAG: DNA recombination protein RmuC, partial [Alcanivorax sp.]|nr:DNA recombination protein RmuC [Alcanivorax sp.]